ncbi:MAG: hypothetical protein ACREL5_12225, partial [Gemmatimonadales bacterium]
LERVSNELVGEARSVSVTFEDAERVSAELRKSTTRTGTLRIITIGGLDRSACGGTHVSRTSEIGAIMLHGVERVRNHVRVGFVAGGRALAHAREGHDLLARLAEEMGCAVAELPDLIATRQREAKDFRERIARFETEVAAARVRALYDAAVPDADGIRRIAHRVTEEPASLIRQMAQAAAGLNRVLFVAIAAEPPAIWFAASADSGHDAGVELKAALAAGGGRGGGSPRVAQGTAGAVDALQGIADRVISPR